jgi:uncharacterized protein YacL
VIRKILNLKTKLINTALTFALGVLSVSILLNATLPEIRFKETNIIKKTNGAVRMVLLVCWGTRELIVWHAILKSSFFKLLRGFVIPALVQDNLLLILF